MKTDMQIYLDLIAVATALVAIWYLIRESRRNNRVILKIKACAASGRQAIDENGGQFFHEFKLVIQNNGISLHHVHAAIGFHGPEGHGWFTLPLKRRKRSGDRDEFAKGMIVEFGFQTYEFDKNDLAFLSMLRDPVDQNAQLRVYSQDFLAASFRIGGFFDRLKSRWNSLAFRFYNLFTHKAGKNKDAMQSYELLPIFTVLGRHVIDFVRWTETEASESKRMAS